MKYCYNWFLRTAHQGGASDSSGMAGALFRPPTPDREEVQEELFVEVSKQSAELTASKVEIGFNWQHQMGAQKAGYLKALKRGTAIQGGKDFVRPTT